MSRPWPHHEWDDDCGCIHCGLDGRDVPKPWPENLPPCPVHDETKRAENRGRYRRWAEQKQADWEDQ